MKILVTGSSGFIGKYLSSFLESRGHHIVRHKRINDDGNEVEFFCDFLNKVPTVKELIGFDVVVHLVGKVHDVRAAGLRSDYETLNNSSVISFAQNCSDAKVSKFIFFSTIKTLNIDSNSLDLSNDLYASSKKKAEVELARFTNKTEMVINIIRPALVYGADVKGNLRALINLIKIGLCPPWPETNNRKFLIHVKDLSEIVSLLIKDSSQNFHIITAAEENPYSTREIMQNLRRALGKKELRLTLPYFLIRSLKRIPFGFGFRLSKLFDDDDYQICNEKLKYRTKYTLRDIFEGK